MTGAQEKPAAAPANSRTAVPPGVQVVTADLDAGRTPERPALAEAVRTLLDALAAAAPGRAVEVRVPPYGAVQCGNGPRHTRGTPGNVVETDPVTWIRLATGRLSWRDALATGRLRASGPHADLSTHLPLLPLSDRG